VTRTLRLTRDSLTELTDGDLAAVAGAAPITQNCQSLDFCFTIPVRDCLGPTT
jgi:hypothetical protein